MTTHQWDRSWAPTLSPAVWQSGDSAIFSPTVRDWTASEGLRSPYRYLLGRGVELQPRSDCMTCEGSGIEPADSFGPDLWSDGGDKCGCVTMHKGTVLFIMLNPSTADATKSDPTVSRCINYAKRWGYGHLLVCNLFAFRSTDPDALYHHPDPVGADNYAWIEDAATYADKIITAWGAHGNLKGQGDIVLSLLLNIGARDKVYCLARTKGGHPSHPLYLKADIVPELWWPELTVAETETRE